MKRIDLIKRLESAGFRNVRDVGDHTIYKMDGYPPIAVPRHREINEYTARAILRVAGL